MPDLIHATARLCKASVPRALVHLSTQGAMARWNLGLGPCREVEPGLFRGESSFDGGICWVRVTVDAGRGRVDYAVVPRIHAEVIGGASLGHPEGTCLVTLAAWRTGDMSDERWQRLVHSHETEIELIRAQLEAATIG